MNLILSAGVVIAAAVIGIMLQRHLLHAIPINYINVFLGMILALIPISNHAVVAFHSELFMGIVVAPLLFFEGMETRFHLVAKKWKQILSLTIIMVLACYVVAGFAAHAVGIMSMPLAFILAAISTPTDATASDAVSDGLVIPKKERTYLKLESLFNDASGLILLNTAILWYVNGYINFTQTLTNFLYSAVGGVIAGFLVAMVLILIRQSILHMDSIRNNPSYNGTPALVIFMATPFFIYYLAEAIHVSGIIAVVCAGLMHNAEAERSRLTNPRLITNSNVVTELFTEIMNGIVFVMLGVVLVRITRHNEAIHSPGAWLFVGMVLYLGNVLVRLVYSKFVMKMDWHASWVFALGGVHGAVTFALAYMVAETAVKRTDFEMVLMAEAVLIILSLLVPTIVFRFILPKEADTHEIQQKINYFRKAMVKHAIDRINQIYLPDELKRQIIFDLRAQMGQTTLRHFIYAFRKTLRQPDMNAAETNTLEMAYRLAFHEEREYLSTISQQEERFMPIVSHLYSEILMAEIVILED